MSNENLESFIPADENAREEESSFAEILSNFEQQHAEGEGKETITGQIVSVSTDSILVDVGRKTDGILSMVHWHEKEEGEPQVGSSIVVSIGPRDEAGYYQLSTIKVERPKDWSALTAAFEEKKSIAGTVVEQVKGGFRVDIGMRAFMPASRSGVREMAEMQALVGQEIRCRITKLDTDKDDIVVDRRVILEEEQHERRQQAFAGLSEGAVVRGRVRSIMDFGAFIDLGGVDGLLHIADMSYTRIAKAGDVVKIGDEFEVKILKIDPTSKKISLGLKQLQEDPWTVASRTFHVGDRVRGTVSRLADFGAFVELLPGVDGLVHLSELSWDKRVRKAGDLLKVGDQVEVVVMQLSLSEKRISLGYKQVLGDPWESVQQKYPVGATIEGPVVNLTAFGGFVELGDGLEGMIHISDITNEKRLDHPKDKLAKGQIVKAVVLDIDQARRRIRLGMRQLEPTTVDTYISEHQPGETVSGRLVDVQGNKAKVELSEGVIGLCRLKAVEEPKTEKAAASGADVSSLSAMLSARWKSGGGTSSEGRDAAKAGQVRSFRIANLDAAKRLIELELAS